MSRFSRFGGPAPEKLTRIGSTGLLYVDYKDIEGLRRSMSPNGKIYGRKRLGTTAREQKLVAQAVKRARHMGFLPFTSATL
ncbi:MAG: 30S ribosomal protein S18 [Planctomycetota bacterium]